MAVDVSEDPASAQNGGFYPKTPRGRMAPEFDQAAFDGPIGEMSDPFRTRFGWHLVKATARGTLSLEETSGLIENELLQQRRKAALQTFVDAAREGMSVEITLPPAADVEEMVDVSALDGAT